MAKQIAISQALFSFFLLLVLRFSVDDRGSTELWTEFVAPQQAGGSGVDGGVDGGVDVADGDGRSSHWLAPAPSPCAIRRRPATNGGR